MAVQEDIANLRRLLESINRLALSNAASLGKLTGELQSLRQELLVTKSMAERAIQMHNDLAARSENR